MRTEGWVRLLSILKKTQLLLGTGLMPLLAPMISSISLAVEANSIRLFQWFGAFKLDFGLFNLADKDTASSCAARSQSNVLPEYGPEPNSAY